MVASAVATTVHSSVPFRRSTTNPCSLVAWSCQASCTSLPDNVAVRLLGGRSASLTRMVSLRLLSAASTSYRWLALDGVMVWLSDRWVELAFRLTASADGLTRLPVVQV